MSLSNARPANGKAAAVRVSRLDEYFPGASHSYKYKQLIPRLDTFHIGRAHWATVESIHRLIAQLIAEGIRTACALTKTHVMPTPRPAKSPSIPP
jgi:hypothetical protein